MRLALLLVILAAVRLAGAQAPLPAGWPVQLPIGMSDAPGGAAALVQAAPFGMRYAYLSGGANTGSGWSTWNTPAGDYARRYIQESLDHGVIPVLVYYQLLQSTPHTGAGEQAQDLGNFANLATMQAWFADLKLMFQVAGAFTGKLVVVNIEPDLWGYIEQVAAGRDPAVVAGKVGSCGGDVAGFPDNASGLARAISHLRDRYAPNVALGFHASVWGTNWDLLSSLPKADDAKASALGVEVGTYFNALGAGFDLLFGEFSDRDAAYYQIVKGSTTSWYHDDDYHRLALFMAGLSATAHKRIAMWQIPIGNTRMRACDNTWGHYQGNQPEWLLEDPARTHLASFVDAGVAAFLFGAGAAGCTVAGDASGDGVTAPAALAANPLSTATAPNDIRSVAAASGATPVYDAVARTLTTPYASDDDGGYLKWQVRGYYLAGAVALDPGAPAPGGSSAGGGGSSGGGSHCGHGAAAAFALLASGLLLRRRRR